jgi:hypothetical protein
MRNLGSEATDQVLKALMSAKREMGDIKKSSLNPFHKSKYAALPAFIEATDEALDRHGLILYQSLDEAFLVTTLAHPESGQWLRSYAPLLNAKGDSQGLGSAITYMRRYSMGALLGLCAEEDDDGNKSCAPVAPKKAATPPAAPAPSARLTENQIEEITSYMKLADRQCALNVWNGLKGKYNIEQFAQIPSAEFGPSITVLKNNIEANNRQKVVQNA